MVSKATSNRTISANLGVMLYIEFTKSHIFFKGTPLHWWDFTYKKENKTNFLPTWHYSWIVLFIIKQSTIVLFIMLVGWYTGIGNQHLTGYCLVEGVAA